MPDEELAACTHGHQPVHGVRTCTWSDRLSKLWSRSMPRLPALPDGAGAVPGPARHDPGHAGPAPGDRAHACVDKAPAGRTACPVPRAVREQEERLTAPLGRQRELAAELDLDKDEAGTPGLEASEGLAGYYRSGPIAFARWGRPSSRTPDG